MVAIIVTGPYVIRSWNTNVKGWEDSTMDSYSEPLVEAPSMGGPSCQCGWEHPCDHPPCCGFEGCDATEKSLVRVCYPLQCEPDVPAQCSTDPSCCRIFPMGCGDESIFPCPIGFMRYGKLCGSDSTPVPYECKEEPMCYRCVGSVFKNAQPCESVVSSTTMRLVDPYDEKNLNQREQPYQLVPKCTTSKDPTEVKCENVCMRKFFYCDQGVTKFVQCSDTNPATSFASCGCYWSSNF